MTAPRPSLHRGPSGSIGPFRVRVLLERLWYCDMRPEYKSITDVLREGELLKLLAFEKESEEDLQRLLGTLASDDAYVGANLEVTPEVYRMVADWAQKYLQSDNQHLVPFIINELAGFVLTKRDSVYRATGRLERIARDPLALPRPGIRVGRERYSGALDRHREAGDIAIDGVRAWEHAEAWIKVRHKLVKSLAKLVKDTPARPYTMSDGEGSYSGDHGGQYQRTWKNLKAIDKAIENIV